MSNFRNKNIWITGATSGIGLELAKQLSAQGANLILSSRNEKKLNDVRDSLPGGSNRHQIVALDLAQAEAVFEKACEFISISMPVDILINNGGVSQRSFALETDLSVYSNLMAINYLGAVALTKAVLPGMVEKGSGQIVAVSSVAGKMGTKLRSAYSGSKYAVIGFMDCLRAEVKQHGIECLTVCPGSIKTNIAINALTGTGLAQNKNDPSIENGMSVEKCVEQIISAMSKGKQEVVIGKGLSVMAPTLKRFFPNTFNYFSAKVDYR